MNIEFLFHIFLTLCTHNNEIINLNLFLLLTFVTFIIFFTIEYSFYVVIKTISPNFLSFFNMHNANTKNIAIITLASSLLATFYTFNDATNLLTQIILSKV